LTKANKHKGNQNSISLKPSNLTTTKYTNPMNTIHHTVLIHGLLHFLSPYIFSH